MNIGIPKERRPFESRVGLSPAGVEILTQHGHQVYVEHEAGIGAGFDDREFETAGARLVYSPEEVFIRADLMLKVARPMNEELGWLRPNTTLAGLLHLASAREDKVEVLLEKKITSIAYEQIEKPDGSLPVLRPFSQIGGKMAASVAARLLQNNWGGKGMLLGGIPGVPPAEVLILGGGVVGLGERTPLLITREMMRAMKPRSVFIDVSIDQGGCSETSRPTTHDHATYVEEGVIHYCVPNMPGVVARTATHAFVNAALPYILEVADLGSAGAIAQNPAIEKAVNTHNGELVHLTLLSKGGHYGLD